MEDGIDLDILPYSWMSLLVVNGVLLGRGLGWHFCYR